jgi:hypothetical protein
MNERIKQLAKQAGFCGTGFHNTLPGTTQEDALKNFAELIVRECTNVCLAQRDPANLNYKPSERFAEAVKQHFGVKR